MDSPTVHLVYDRSENGNFLPNGLRSQYINQWKCNDQTGPHIFNVLTRYFPSDRTLLGYFPLIIESSFACTFTAVDVQAAPPGAINWLVIEPSSIDKSFVIENCISSLTSASLQAVRSGRVTLVIYYAFEAFSFGYREFMSTLERSLAFLEIPPSNVVLIFGDLNAQLNYKDYAQHNKLYFEWKDGHILSFDHYEFEYWHYADWLSRLGDASRQLVKEESLEVVNRPNTFLCLNAGGRTHRRYVVAELFRLKLHSHALISYLIKYFEPVSQTMYIRTDDAHAKAKTLFHRDWEEHAKAIHLPTDEVTGTWHNRGMVAEHYLKTHFSIVTESFPERPCFFVTEKTFKPILNLHPFLLVNAPGSLQYLRSRGYETFPEVFDESYDEVEDDSRRLDAIIENVHRAVSRKVNPYSIGSVREKLRHNRALFLSQNHARSTHTLISDLIRLHHARKGV